MGEKEDIAKDTGGGTDEKKPEVRKLFINWHRNTTSPQLPKLGWTFRTSSRLNVRISGINYIWWGNVESKNNIFEELGMRGVVLQPLRTYALLSPCVLFLYLPTNVSFRFTRRRDGRDERLCRDLRTDVALPRDSWYTCRANDVTSSAAVAWHADCTAQLQLFKLACVTISTSSLTSVWLNFFFFNSVLFAICTSTLSKLRENMYTVECRRVFSSAPL
jgi:hypothetical protein